MIRALILSLTLLLSGVAVAASPGPDEIMQDPSLELRAADLYAQLRCVVCQSQSLAHSNADLAADMRAVVRERLLTGQSNREVLEYMHIRYGDYVLMMPPFQANTLVLWLMPAVLLLGGGLGIAVFLRQQNRRAAIAGNAALDPDDEARLAQLMAEEGQE